VGPGPGGFALSLLVFATMVGQVAVTVELTDLCCPADLLRRAR
jgi:hypothetical protein